MDIDIVIAAMRTGNFDAITDIKECFLKDKRVYDYVLQFYTKHGVFPNEDTIVQDLKIPKLGDLEPPAYYAEKLLERHKLGLLRKIGEKVQSVFNSNTDVDASADHIRTILADFETYNQDDGFIEVGDDADRRKTDYLEAKRLGGDIGLSSPWAELDAITLGWCDGTVNLVIGPTEIGKTWFLVKQFEHSYREGHNPLFVSIEMVCRTVAQRFDSVYTKLNYGDMRKGELDVSSEQQYFDALAEMNLFGDDGWITDASRIQTVSQLEYMVKRLNPGIILLDGLYLLKSNLKGGMWETLTEVIRQLQLFCNNSKIPLIATTQFNRNVKKGSKDGSLSDIGYAYSLAQGADIGIALKQDDYQEAAKEITMEIVKGREFDKSILGITTGWDIPVNFDFIAYDYREASGQSGGGYTNNNPGDVPF